MLPYSSIPMNLRANIVQHFFFFLTLDCSFQIVQLLQTLSDDVVRSQGRDYRLKETYSLINLIEFISNQTSHVLIDGQMLKIHLSVRSISGHSLIKCNILYHKNFQ